MKFKIKLLATFLVITLLLGCETQEDFVKESGKKINTETVSFKTLFSKIQNKRMNASGKNLFQQKSTGNLNRSEEDFIKDIDTTTIEKVVIDGKESYTLRIITEDDTEDRFYNMVVYEKDGVYYTNYIRYDGIDDTKEGAEKVINSIKTAVDEDGIEFSDANPQENKDNCSSFAPIWQCSCGNAHSPNDAEGPNAICIAESWIVVGFTEINVPCSGDAQGNAPNHPNGNEAPAGTTPSSNQSGGGSGGGSGSGGNPVYTIPVTPKKTAKKIRVEFLLTLNNAQLNWWNDHSNQADTIITYLTANQTLTVDEQTPFEFAQELITQMVQNPGLDLNIDSSIKSPANIDRSTIIDATTAGEKFNDVYDELLKSPKFKELFIDLFQENQRFNVKFQIGPVPNSTTGGITETDLLNPTLNIITISPQFLANNSKLVIAKTIIHECIHAFLNVKLCEPTIGMSIPNINNMDVTDCINTYYNGFNGPQVQHNFIYNFMLPTMVQILSEVKDLLVSPSDNTSIMTTVVMPNYPNPPILPFNWNDCLYYLSLGGLQNCTFFQTEIGTIVINSSGQVVILNTVDLIKMNYYNQYQTHVHNNLHP